MKPTVITTRKVLPFGELSPLEFERLCLWLVEREGYLRPQHLGEAGGEQGRDVVAFKAGGDGEELWYFQCKRYNRLDAPTLKKEVDKYNALAESNPTKRPAGIVFVTNAAVSAAIQDAVAQYCRQFGYVSVFWARTELDMLVKKHPDIIEEFFDAPRTRTPSALHQLPSPPRDFTGRVEELAELTRNVETGGVNISGLRGMGGVGKTALALKLAEHLAPLYPDAQFYLDLKGASAQPVTTADAMLHVIRAYDPTAGPPKDEAELHARYRSVLHGQRALLLMDNASGREQVEPLIPPDTCVLLVTSRRHFALPGLFDKDLDKLLPDDARKLLLKIAPRIGEQADEIACLCGNLPLALRLAASTLAERRDLSPSDYLRRLSNAPQRLELIDASLALSYDLLSPEMQKLWRTLAVFPDTFDAPAAAAIWELNPDAAQDAIGELVKHSLLDWDEETARYRLHDLARLFADARLSVEERNAGQLRHAEHYLSVFRKANEFYEQGGEGIMRGLALFDLEWRNMRSGQTWASSEVSDNERAAELCNDYPRAGAHILDLRHHPRERIRWREVGLAVARRSKERGAEGAHLSSLGNAYADLGEARLAVEFYEQALAVMREVGDRRGEGDVLGNLGLVYADLGELHRAIELYEQELVVVREIGNRRGEGGALSNMGVAYKNLGEVPRAIEMYEQALVVLRKLGRRSEEGAVLGNLGVAYAALSEPGRAVEFYEQRLAIAREIGDRRGEGIALWNMSLALDKLGERARAIAHAETSLKIKEEIEDPVAGTVREQLAEWRGEA